MYTSFYLIAIRFVVAVSLSPPHSTVVLFLHLLGNLSFVESMSLTGRRSAARKKYIEEQTQHGDEHELNGQTKAEKDAFGAF